MIAGTAPKQWGRFWGGFFPIWELFFEKTTPKTTPELWHLLYLYSTFKNPPTLASLSRNLGGGQDGIFPIFQYLKINSTKVTSNRSIEV
jgi:hypothetical protein